MLKVKVKYVKTKYRPAGILLNVNTMIYFRLKLKLRFRSNKNYSSVAVNSRAG